MLSRLLFGHGTYLVDETPSDSHPAVFRRADVSPEFAAFCVTHDIPEELYEQYIETNALSKKLALRQILHRISQEQRVKFIEQLPTDGMNLDQIQDMLSCLSESEQLLYIHKLSHCLADKITEFHELEHLLKRRCASHEVQMQLISAVSVAKIKTLMEDSYQLVSFARMLKPACVGTVVRDHIGSEFVCSLIDEPYYYNEFLKYTLASIPEQQVPFIKSLFPIEKIQTLTQNHCFLTSIMEVIRSEERLAYITELVGVVKLREVLCRNYCMLESVLEKLAPDDRMSLMFDVIGVDEMRLIIPINYDKRPQEAVTGLLSPEQITLFYEKIIPEEQKEAQAFLVNVKKKLIKFSFPVGFWGMGNGGVEITLDTGDKKVVPTSVKKQWDEICRAESGHVSWLDAKRRVCELANKASEKSGGLTHFTRQEDTRKWYKAFPVVSSEPSASVRPG